MSNEEKKTNLDKIRKLILSIALLLFVLVLGVLVWQNRIIKVTYENFELVAGGESISMEEFQDSITKGRVERFNPEKLEQNIQNRQRKIEKDFNILDEYFKEVNSNVELQQKLDSSLLALKRAKATAEGLLKKFKAYDKMNYQQKAEILIEGYSFIGRIAGYGPGNIEGLALEYKEKQLIIDAQEKEDLKAQLEKAMAQVEVFRDINTKQAQDIIKLQAKVKRLTNKFAKSYNKLANKIDLLDELLARKNSNMAVLIKEKAQTEKELDEAREDLEAASRNQLELAESLVPVRVTNLSFVPKRDKEKDKEDRLDVGKNNRGEYHLWQIDAIRLEFTLASNLTQGVLRGDEKYELVIETSRPTTRKERKKGMPYILWETYECSVPIGVQSKHEFPVDSDNRARGVNQVKIYLQTKDGRILLASEKFYTKKSRDA